MTDPRTPRGARRGGPTSLELRLYAAALVAIAYVVAWREVSRPSTTPIPSVVQRPPARAAIWLDDVPVAQRPAIALPPGWRVAGADPVERDARVEPAPRVVRASPARPVRVRTRSS